MITILSQHSGKDLRFRIEVERLLVDDVRTYGHITSLDRWAHGWGICPKWVRICAHSAAQKGLVKLTRLTNVPGRPYRVTALEERPHD